MAWVTPTISDLQAVLGANQISQYSQSSIADGQPDVVTDSLAKVCQEIRGYLFPFTFDFGPDGTIPPECLRHAMNLCACNIMSRMSIEIPKSKEADRKAAVDFFTAVAKGEIRVVGNSTNLSSFTGGVMPSFGPRCRTFGRHQEDGI